MRAAEIRDSEQQQVFDALDEIHARLAPLESLGSVRKRLSEMPDRTEVSVLAERLDEALARLEAQDGAIAALARAVESVVDKLATPFAELGGRLDGVAGRFEGVAGRMDGLEDRIAGLHKRLDDLHHQMDKQDIKLDSLPAAVHGPVRERIASAETGLRTRLDEVDEGVHEHLDGVQRALGDTEDRLAGVITTARVDLTASVDAGRDAVHGAISTTRDELTGAIDAQTTQLDPHFRLEGMSAALDTLAERLDTLSSRLDGVESGVGERIAGVAERLGVLDDALAARPDAHSLVELIRQANEESEVRHAGQLDEAMATFAEIIMGGPPAHLSATPPPPPRPAQRRVRKAAPKPRDTDAEEAAAS